MIRTRLSSSLGFSKQLLQALGLNACSERSLDGIFVDHAVLHDDGAILLRIADEIDVLERAAVDQQKEGAYADLLLVGVGVN